jgi:hypothetical protein
LELFLFNIRVLAWPDPAPKEFSEIKVIHDAKTNGHLTLQHKYDFDQKGPTEARGDGMEDDFSLL